MDVAMRVCGKCGEQKALSAFVKHKGCRDGRAGTCRACAAAYSKEWKRKHAKEYAARRRQLYAEKYGPINRANEERRKREYPLKVRAQILRGGMRERSRKRGLSFEKDTLTVRYLMDWLVSDPRCECCGKDLDIGFKPKGPNNASPSIDRVNPTSGYVVGNVALLCWRCNNLKRDATADELRIIADWMDAWGSADLSDNQEARLGNGKETTA